LSILGYIIIHIDKDINFSELISKYISHMNIRLALLSFLSALHVVKAVS